MKSHHLTRPVAALAFVMMCAAGLTLTGCRSGEAYTSPTRGGGLNQQGEIDPAGPQSGAGSMRTAPQPAGTSGNPASGSTEFDGTTSPPIRGTGGSY